MAYTTIDDPSAYFQCTLHTGTGSEQVITHGGNSDLQADLVWIKRRDSANNHRLTDVVRGVTEELYTDIADAEDTQAQGLKSFASDGFTLGTNAGYNANNGTYVSWNWKAGGSASNNTDGNTTTSVSVNQDAGFSIMKYAGDGNDSTIGHGLGAKPEYIIFKEIDGTESWRVHSIYTPSNASNTLALNLSDAAFSQSNWISAISNTTISIGTDSSFNTDGNNYIAYAFAPKQGYSKFGSYIGNGNADGTFVYLGFKPAFFLVKRTDSTPSWTLLDNKRDPFNVTTERLFPNENVAGSVGVNANTDFLSNGVKIRVNHNNFNTSGGTYIYMAIAENPLVTSTGVPTTAR